MTSSLFDYFQRNIRVALAQVAIMAAVWPLSLIPSGFAIVSVVILPTVLMFWWQVIAHRYKIQPLIINSSAALFATIWAFLFVGDISFANLQKGLVLGMPRVLSTNYPLTDPKWPMVPIVILVCIIASVGGALSFRSRSLGLPILTLVAFSASFAFVIGGMSGRSIWAFSIPAIACLVAVILHSSLGETTSEKTSPLELRSALPSVQMMVTLTLSIALAWISSTVLINSDRDMVQPRLVPNVREATPDSPLLVVQQMRESTNDETVMLVKENDSEFIHLATMEVYDGQTWEAANRFQTGNGKLRLSDTSNSSVTAKPFSLTSVNVALTGGWIPFIGRPLQLLGSEDVLQPTTNSPIGFIPSRTNTKEITVSGTADTAIVPKLGSSNNDQSVSVAPTSSSNRQIADRICAKTLSRIRTDNPGWQPTLSCSSLSELSVADVLDIVNKIQDRRSRIEDSSVATSNSSWKTAEYLPSLLLLMDAPRTSRPKERVGSPEQFATAATLVLQSLGIPAVIATGFHNKETPESISTTEAWTWVEVPLSDGGWAIFDPTPISTDEIDGESSKELTATTTSIAATTTTTVEPETGVVDLPIPPPISHSNQLPVGVVLLLIVIGLFFVLALLRTVSNWRRRHSRINGDSRNAIIGGWHNLLESAYGAGLRNQVALTASELIDEILKMSQAALDDARSESIVRSANAAVFGITEPSHEDVQLFTQLISQVESQLKTSMPLTKRIASWAWPMPSRILAGPNISTTSLKIRRFRLRRH